MGRGQVSLAWALPYALGAALYLSVVFAMFAAVPLVYIHLRQGRAAGVLCSATNLAIVWLATGQISAAVFFVTGVVLAAGLAEGIRLRLRPDGVVGVGVLSMAGAMLLLVATYSAKFQANPVERVQQVIASSVDKVAEDIERYKAQNRQVSNDLERILVDPQTTKRNIFNELPSVLGIVFLLLSAANFLLMTRLNPMHVREVLGLPKNFFRRWKASDHMIWPTLAAGFCLVVEMPYLSTIALNVFKILMTVYAIQGLAILSAFFESWRLRPSLKPLCYGLAVAVLLPLVISLGFFDLWFDFRNKFNKEK